MPTEARHGWRARGVVLLLASALLIGAGWLVARARAAELRPSALSEALRTAREDVNAPGAEAAIVVCGRVAWSGADGVLDVDSGRRVLGDTRFVIASSTKTVTATMVMQRLQAGALGPLGLDTPLARFYPRLPNASKITVRMLLRNRSGLRNYDDLQALQRFLDNDTHVWQRDQILNAMNQTRPLFSPNARFEYINTNWIVLGGILEKVTPGISIESYFQQNIAAKAGMRFSTWTRTPALSRVLAHAYTDVNGDPKAFTWIPGFGPPTSVFGPVFTDGGLVSTATDLARFGNALLDGRLVNPELVNQMTDVRGNDDYGLGTDRISFDGHSWFGHDGSYDGYESENHTDRTRHVTIAVTSNMDSTAYDIWTAVAQAYDKQAGNAPTTCQR